MLIKNKTQPYLTSVSLAWLCLFLFIIPESVHAAEHSFRRGRAPESTSLSQIQGGSRYRVENRGHRRIVGFSSGA